MGYTPPWLNVLAPSGYVKVYGNTPLKPYIYFVDSGYLYIVGNDGDTIRIGDTSADFLKIYDSATDAVFETAPANTNLYLNATGTGKVKFGTFTGSGDVAINGSISILDSGGSARKLATVA